MMARACFFSVSHSHVRVLAIAVGRRGPNLHASLLYRDSNSTVQFMDIDLAGTVTARPVENEKNARRDFWAVPSYSNTILAQVAAYCESVGKATRHLSYAFPFDETCELRIVEGQCEIVGCEGFTCSTFVLAIFQHLKLRLLDTSNWKLVPEDADFQSYIVDFIQTLKQKGKLNISDAEIEKRRSEIPCFRFSPLDVIGACRVGKYPGSFEESRRMGEECKQWMTDAERCHVFT